MRTGTPDLLYPQRCLTLLGLGPLQKLTCQRQGHAQGNGEGGDRLHEWMVPLAAWVSNGFGPVAPTRRCGTQSSTWTKPSNEAPSRTQTSYSERRWNFTWVKSSKSV